MHHSQAQLKHTSHEPFTRVDHKLPERRFSLLTSRRLGGYAHMGDAVPHTQHIHFNSLNFSNRTSTTRLHSNIQPPINISSTNNLNFNNNSKNSCTHLECNAMNSQETIVQYNKIHNEYEQYSMKHTILSLRNWRDAHVTRLPIWYGSDL